MRDPNKLDAFYNELKSYHKEYFPDWRFGQLIMNFVQWTIAKDRNQVIFYTEEDELLNYFHEFAEDMKAQVKHFYE